MNLIPFYNPAKLKREQLFPLKNWKMNDDANNVKICFGLNSNTSERYSQTLPKVESQNKNVRQQLEKCNPEG